MWSRTAAVTSNPDLKNYDLRSFDSLQISSSVRSRRWVNNNCNFYNRGRFPHYIVFYNFLILVCSRDNNKLKQKIVVLREVTFVPPCNKVWLTELHGALFSLAQSNLGARIFNRRRKMAKNHFRCCLLCQGVKRTSGPCMTGEVSEGAVTIATLISWQSSKWAQSLT